MKKLIMMRGIPASGKSTKAAELSQLYGMPRVNKDLLRTMLHFDKWSGKNESVTSEAETALIRTLLKSHPGVIVDNTNLTERHLAHYKEIAESENVGFEVVEMTTPYYECIERDKYRTKQVGPGVILKFGLLTGQYPVPEKPLVICDIDGTIANIDHRLKYVKGEKKDWKMFFMHMESDELRDDTLVTLLKYQEAGHKIIFVSARPEDYRIQTERWLETHCASRGLKYEGVLMRRQHDKRDDVEVKSEIYDELFRNKYEIEIVIDDRPKVIRMWRAKMLNVLDCGPGIEF